MARRTSVTQALWIDGEPTPRTAFLSRSGKSWADPGAYLDNDGRLLHLEANRDGLTVDILDRGRPSAVRSDTEVRFLTVKIDGENVPAVEYDGKRMVNATGDPIPFLTRKQGGGFIVPEGIEAVSHINELSKWQVGVVFILTPEAAQTARGTGNLDIIHPYVGSDLDKCPILNTRSRMPEVYRDFVRVGP